MSDKIEHITSKHLEYSTQYNELFRKVTNTPITTVEVSPTGSGKTHFYKDSANTIMLMPTNSMVVQNDGLISPNKAEEYNTDDRQYRTSWTEIDFDKCEYMTYDKFYGHIKHKKDISSLNIIIDEAHNLLSTDKKEYGELINKLLNRKIKYKELKLITATLRYETLEFYSPIKFDVQSYSRKDFTPHINFVYQFPKIDDKMRTLIFINSIEKMYIIEDYCTKHYPNIKVLILQSKVTIPTKDEMEQYQVILSTSVIKEGYSIENKIDKLIIFNKFNSCGAMEILQYMARPRNQTPDTYVVMADTHFKNENSPKYKDYLDIIEPILETVKEKGVHQSLSEFSESIFTLNYQDYIKSISDVKYHGNPTLSSYLYNKVLKTSELYYNNGEFMKMSIKIFTSNATVNIIKSLDSKDTEPIEFTKLDISEYKDAIEKSCNSKDEVIEKSKELIEDVSISKEITEKDKKIITKKLQDIQKVEPFLEFEMEDKRYQYTDKIIVKQMIYEKIFNKCKWHKHNLDKNIYKLMKGRIKSTERLKVGDILMVSKIRNKFKSYVKDLHFTVDILERKKKLSPDDKVIMSIQLLERLYSFDKYYTDNKIEEKQVYPLKSKKVEYTIIRALYPVYDSWYYLEKHPGLNIPKNPFEALR